MEQPFASRASAVGKVRSLNILLADDHPAVRSTTAGLLQELGHSVTDASGGVEILALVENAPDAFDLIVTDYAMPTLSGTELVRRIREICPGMPAIIVTGYADITTISNRPEDVILLSKPFAPQEIDQAIRMVMETRTAA